MKLVLFVFAIGATGCALFYDPDVGAEIPQTADSGVIDVDGNEPVADCDNSDSNPDVAVSFARDIRPLMIRVPGGCSPCHLGRVTSGLDLSSYASLRRGGLNTGTNVIIAGDPCHSIIPKKLSRTPPFGSRMPFNGPPYFSAEERQLVRDWIAEGAANN